MSLLEKMVREDRVWSALSAAVPAHGSASSRRFRSIDCPMCVTRGHPKGDGRKRCGITYDGQIGVNCFNCQFKCRFVVGQPMSGAMRAFLRRVGVPENEVSRLNHWALTISSIRGNSTAPVIAPDRSIRPSFPTVDLPPGARSLDAWAAEGCDDPSFLDAAEYLYSRGEEIANATTYYWTPSKAESMNGRLIVPCLFEERIVGFIARAVRPGLMPRYLDRSPKNYLFNPAALSAPERRFVLIMDGVFDALAVDGVATRGSTLNDSQIAWLNGCGKTVILVPDRDTTAAALIDLATVHGWCVSFPRSSRAGAGDNWWHDDIKDVADAVTRYGKLYTLRSVVAKTMTRKIEISITRKLYI